MLCGPVPSAEDSSFTKTCGSIAGERLVSCEKNAPCPTKESVCRAVAGCAGSGGAVCARTTGPAARTAKHTAPSDATTRFRRCTFNCYPPCYLKEYSNAYARPCLPTLRDRDGGRLSTGAAFRQLPRGDAREPSSDEPQPRHHTLRPGPDERRSRGDSRPAERT